jgi:hypothetical protein
MSALMGLLCVSSSSNVNALPTTPKMKKNIIKLNSILVKAPNIIGLNVEAIVPALLTALTPMPTTLVGNSSTIYTKNRMNSVAIANLKKKITITSMILSKQNSHPSGFLITLRIKELTTVAMNSQNPVDLLFTLSIK